MSTDPARRDRPGEAVAGLMAAGSLAVSVVGLVERPARIVPGAILVALVAAAIGGRHSRLAALAVAVGAICFLLGMTIAVATERPIW